MLPVHESFYTFQGEGAHAGRAAWFIRTFGCPVHCPWCDSAGTWHPDYTPAQIPRREEVELAAAAARTRAEFIVVTGGEPAIHNLRPLTDALHALDLKVHLETSGAFPIHGDFDWVTLSPKRWRLPLAENIARSDEFKIIVDETNAIEEYRDILSAGGLDTATTQASIWLHPEWSLRDTPAILDGITEWVKKHGAPYRAGWQLHKNFSADLRDPGSRPAAPLGGNPEQGF
ncbi:MAG: 7-carboxy-7-deazaguanine synthase QueE [Opitutales bacterium]